MPDYSHITIPSRDDHEAFCDHVIAVEKARKGRLKLVARPYGSTNWCDRVKYNTSEPFSPLDWQGYDYAILSEPPKKVLAPWKLGPELLGKRVKHRETIYLITSTEAQNVSLGGCFWISPSDLLKDAAELLPDGTEGPCGTWEEQA